MPTAHGPPIRLERLLKAPRSKVWEMWTTKAGLAQWYAPEPWRAEFHQLDVRAGGSYEGDVVLGDERIHNHGIYTEVIPGRVLAWTDRFDMLPEVEPYATHGRIELHEAVDGTRLAFMHSALHDEEWTRHAMEGWTTTLGQLQRLLDPAPRVPAT